MCWWECAAWRVGGERAIAHRPAVRASDGAAADAGALPTGSAGRAATRDTVAGLFLVELAALPVASSSGGFVYTLNPALGVVERASGSFGPFFTERTLQNGRGQTSIGISQQFSSFSSLQGADLRDGTFPTNAARLTGATQPFSVDTLQLTLDAHTTTLFANRGMTDRLAVGVAFPSRPSRSAVSGCAP